MSTRQKVAEASPFRYCGRTFSRDGIESIRRITDDGWCTTRTGIGRAVCKVLHRVKPDGQPKLLTGMICIESIGRARGCPATVADD